MVRGEAGCGRYPLGYMCYGFSRYAPGRKRYNCSRKAADLALMDASVTDAAGLCGSNEATGTATGSMDAAGAGPGAMDGE